MYRINASCYISLGSKARQQKQGFKMGERKSVSFFSFFRCKIIGNEDNTCNCNTFSAHFMI